MAYHICYGESFTKTSYTEQPARKKKRQTAIWIITVCLILIFALSSYSDHIRSILLPGNDAVTAAALSGLEEDVRNGVSIKEALSTFCLEILENEAQ